MNARELLGLIQSDIERAAVEGQVAVPIRALRDYLTELGRVLDDASGPPDPAKLEHYKAQLSLHQSQYEAEVATNLELFRSVLTSGQWAMRSSLLLNGAAATALLAFLAHRGATSQATAAYAAWLATLGLGALLAVVAFGGTYLTQCAYSENRNRLGGILRWASIALVVLSYLSFGAAVIGVARLF